MDMLSKFILPGILFLLTLVFGFWLSHLGKPYHSILFNVHKLIALGTVVVAVIQLSQMLKNADARVLIIALLVVAALCVVALFISGALMSMGKLDYALTLTIHRIALLVVIIALAPIVYLLGRKP
jgi:chromate transport protein ChrA